MASLKELFSRISDHHLNLIGQCIKDKPVPLGKLAKSLGLIVKISNLDSGVSGSIETIQGEYKIKVNRYESRERQRFTLAHEIAHFLLHRDRIDKAGGIVDNVLYRSKLSEKIEVEANKLASELILPSFQLKKELKEFKDPLSDDEIEELADSWQVSKRVLEIKIGRNL